MRLSTLGLVTVIASAFAAPAFAGTPGSISGSATFISPAGFTSTTSGESVLASGFQFGTAGSVLTGSTNPTAANPFGAKASLATPDVIVLPQFSLQGFSVAAESLQVASSGAVAPTTFPASFNQAAARVLTDAAAAIAQGTTFLVDNGRTTGNGTAAGTTYASANIDFISAIIKAGAGVNGLD
ncbi:hypothetical protein Syn7502_00823 [Synechococcus sp. PCC 7502]|uniref:hypothetical protein n=1 Tax=Synechococcus sp. PCC 7502 TaxID=1173263 RepID=UPI00029F95F9|nr:hypothetical protein [Synechococcus sp. PCC 7502]AFY72955.1 hypothetical protein Syn7502_00823 [Synechococcus sp. PCC 7502]